MAKSFNENDGSSEKSGSIAKKFRFFSIILFLIIFVGGSAAFVFSMRQIVRESTVSEMARRVEIERIKLEASVNGEIAIAMKMADSPLIKHYFQNPHDPDLEKEAFEEIAAYRRAFAGNSVFWVNDIDHKFYSDDAFAFDLDPKDPNNYWYLMTLNDTEKYNFNINYNPDLNVTNLWINAPVFNSSHKPIGILGTGIDLTAFINSIYKDFSGNGELYFFNAAGEITGTRDTKLIVDKKTISDVFGALGDGILSVAKNISGGNIESFNYQSSEIAVGPVPALEWYAVLIMPLTLGDYLNNSMTILFVAVMAVVLIIFVVFNIFIASFVKPLKTMVDILNHISGDWDLTRRLDVKGNDEIGRLAVFFNNTFERIRELLKGIRNDAASLSDTGEDLAANMTETAAAINEITSNVQSMKSLVQSQAKEVNATDETVEQIIGGLDKLNGHIAEQAESVAQSSSAIEEMLANIRAVTETLIKNTVNITNLAESSETSQADLQKVSADIQEIARESEGLMEINSVMQNISSQTNLLAMNAAIEAAHAGESGKGFAVVADEIRKLAENSSKQSKTISTVLKKIKTSIDAITKSTGIVLDRFENMAREVDTVSKQESQIRSAMEEQETGSRQILEAVGQLNSITGLVRTASSEMTSEGKDVVTQSSGLKQISEEVGGGMDEMALGADQINIAVHRVNEISIKNKNNIDTLKGEISKFKVD